MAAAVPFLIQLAVAVGSTLVSRALSAKSNTPFLSDLTVQTSTYGNMIPLAWGPENRMAGNVTWSSGIKRLKHRHGKGFLGVALTGGLSELGDVGAIFTGGLSLLNPLAISDYFYSVDCAINLVDCSTRGPISGVSKVWANGKLIYDRSISSGPLSEPDSKNTSWTAFRVYRGTFDQMPDPTIEATVGVGKTPGYRGSAYVVFADFQLADYGYRMPNFEFLVEADDEIQVSEILSDIVEQSGIDPNTASTTSINGTLRGYAIASAATASAVINPLGLAFNFDAAENGGALRFFARGVEPVGIIDPDDMGAYQSTDSQPQVITFTRIPETSLPQLAGVTYIDPTMDWQASSQIAQRAAGNAQSNISIALPLVLDADTARHAADRFLWEAWMERFGATLALSDRWIDIEPGRSYLFETPAGFESFRVTSKTRGANGVIEITIVADRGQSYSSVQTGAPGNVPPQIVLSIPETFLLCLDIPILRDADDDTGFYTVVGADSLGWRGADIVRSVDGGSTYSEVVPMGSASAMGYAESVATGTTSIIDRATTIRVHLIDVEQELETITELQMLNGANGCWIGQPDGEDGEILQFMTATLIEPGVYDLTDLLRGRLGTEYAVSTHGPDESFVLLQGATIARVDFSVTDWNNDRLYKSVSILTDESLATPLLFTNTGEGKRPLSPVHIVSLTDSGDTTINWMRRSRYRQPGLGRGPLALGETVEAYEVDLSVGSSVVRTLTSSTQTVIYTAAMQAADGVSSGDTIQAAVYQMSDSRGRGRPGYAELTI